MELHVRFGQAGDAEAVTDFIMTAGDGLFEFLLDGLVPGVKARNLMRMAVVDMESVLCYRNAMVAELDGELVGLVLGYPSKDYGIPPVVKTVVPNKRLKHVQGILNSRIDESWYINSLSVLPSARGRGIARLLLECASDLAVEEGFNTISLHAWGDNETAVGLYTREGFEVEDRIRVEPEKRLEHCGEMLLMRASLPLMG